MKSSSDLGVVCIARACVCQNSTSAFCMYVTVQIWRLGVSKAWKADFDGLE